MRILNNSLHEVKLLAYDRVTQLIISSFSTIQVNISTEDMKAYYINSCLLLGLEYKLESRDIITSNYSRLDLNLNVLDSFLVPAFHRIQYVVIQQLDLSALSSDVVISAEQGTRTRIEISITSPASSIGSIAFNLGSQSVVVDVEPSDTISEIILNSQFQLEQSLLTAFKLWMYSVDLANSKLILTSRTNIPTDTNLTITKQSTALLTSISTITGTIPSNTLVTATLDITTPIVSPNIVSTNTISSEDRIFYLNTTNATKLRVVVGLENLTVI